jgi:membrane protein DedA with SNARE-associated domain
MDNLSQALAAYGYQLLFVVVLLEAIGIPVPAAIALLVSGGAIAAGDMNLATALLTGIAAMLLGDNLLYAVGRYSGWGLLGFLCRVSLNPENCIMNSARTFHRRGRIVLLFAKFVPGINTMAPPLAGSMAMPWLHFFVLDACGTLLYISAWTMVGFLFSDAMESIKGGFHAAGSLVETVVISGFILWVANRVRIMWKEKKLVAPPVLAPSAAAARLAADTAAVYDVRSHGYYDQDAVRIQGSRRLDPHTFRDSLQDLPLEKDILLYCT